MFMLRQCCAYALVMFRHKNNLVTVGRSSCFALEYLFLWPQTRLELSRSLIKETRSYHKRHVWKCPEISSELFSGVKLIVNLM